MTQTYAVRSGDTVSELAARFGVDAGTLMRANGMNPALADGRVTSSRADPDRLQVGQRLTIPSATPGYERGYSVQSGDTLNELAARWGVSLESVLAANPQFDASRADGRVDMARGASGSWDPDALRIGDSLRRPGVASPALQAKTAVFADLTLLAQSASLRLTSRADCGGTSCEIMLIDVGTGSTATDGGATESMRLADGSAARFRPTTCGGSCSPALLLFERAALPVRISFETGFTTPPGTRLDAVRDRRLLLELAGSSAAR